MEEKGQVARDIATSSAPAEDCTAADTFSLYQMIHLPLAWTAIGVLYWRSYIVTAPASIVTLN